MPWITARAALDRDFQRQGANLLDLAADGLVRTQAAALSAGRSEPQRDVQLPTSFWRTMQRLTGSAYRDWLSGTFKTGIADFTGTMPRDAQRAAGVMFEEIDLDAYLPAARSSIVAEPNQSSQAQTDDDLILALMHSRIVAQQYKSANAAAQALAPIAHGGGTEESKAARLRKAYAAKFGSG